MARQTEFEFTLPVGYTGEDGVNHRQGIMRMATAMDEIAPLRDVRVRGNQAYLAVMLLSRVITKLGTLPSVPTNVIKNPFVAALAYLQALYGRINEKGKSTFTVSSPPCNTNHEVELAALAEF